MSIQMHFAAINGYGVPQDIFSDPSYHSYLGQVFNYLWDRYAKTPVTIICAGGPTDMVKPYKRTEAGEMARWFLPRIRAARISRRWKVMKAPDGLNVLDNMLAVHGLVGGNTLNYFCEVTRVKKTEALGRAIFGRRIRIVPIDFDTSPPRYDTATRRAMEAEDERFCMRALKDPSFARRLRTANMLKLQTLRRLPPTRRARDIDRITRRIRQKLLLED